MKKTSKKLIAVIICIIMLVSLIPASAFAAGVISGGIYGDGLTWVLKDDGTFIISGNGPLAPEYFANYPWGMNQNIRHVIIEEGITGIEWRAFERCINIETVSLPRSLTYIEEFAFYDCEKLTEINLSENVHGLGEGAFAGCTSLEGIWVAEDNEYIYSDEHGVVYKEYDDEKILLQTPGQLSGDYVVEEGTTEINSYAFNGCVEVKSITVPESVTKIGDSVFTGCTKLEKITLPKGLTELGSHTFAACEALTGIDIPDGVTTIEMSAFLGCSSLVEIDFPESLTEFERYAFADCTSLETVVLPEGLTTVDYSVFSGCTSLTSVTIPKSLNYIGYSMFTDCSSLTSITIHDSIMSIANDAFDGCTSLTGIWVDEANTVFSNDEHGVLFNKDKTKLIKIPGGLTGTYTIPAGIAEISSRVFFDCINLSGIVFDESNPDYCSVDGTVLNKDKTHLVYVPGAASGSYTIPDGVTSIGSNAFYGCDEITEVIIPDGVTKIYENAFIDCTGITSLDIPGSVTYLGIDVFHGCDNLTEVKFHGDAINMGPETFGDMIFTAYFPAGNDTWPNWINYVDYYGGDIIWYSYDEEGNTTLYEPGEPVFPDDPYDPIIPKRPKGDIDGNYEVTNSELIMTARYIVGLSEESSVEHILISHYADMNGDEEIGNADLVAMARYIISQEDSLG